MHSISEYIPPHPRNEFIVRCWCTRATSPPTHPNPLWEGSVQNSTGNIAENMHRGSIHASEPPDDNTISPATHVFCASTEHKHTRPSPVTDLHLQLMLHLLQSYPPALTPAPPHCGLRFFLRFSSTLASARMGIT